jgi:Phosphotransferase enzyme family
VNGDGSDVEPDTGDEGAWQTEVSWIVLDPDRAAVLVTDGPEPVGLPSTTLSGRTWLGDAPVLTAALAELGLDAVMLGCRDVVEDHSNQVQRLTVLATLRPGPVATPMGTRWAHRDDLPDPVPAGIETVRAGRPPWEAPDWFPATETWLRDQLAARGRTVTGRVEQSRCWELSSVLRAPATGGPVWLKASAGSSLFTDEGALMALLADWFPAHVRAPLAWDDDRRLVLMEDFGPILGWDAPIEIQEQVLADFARLQAETAERLPALRAVGLADRTPSRLAEQAAAWFPDLDSTARLPGLDPQTWLTKEETAALQAALPRLLELCEELATGPAPITLLHGDLHMNNVAAEPTLPRPPVLFDWTDSSIGHPFFDLITALHGPEADRIRLREAYVSAWADYGSPDRLAEAWRAVAILGPLHHAISYRAIAAGCAPPVDSDMASGTAHWLRSVLAALRRQP